jgi:hypothetical protein
MADFVTLSCPCCGGKLEITNDLDRFACGFCGQEHVVRRGGGVVSLAPVVEGLKQVQLGVDKTASELAIVRLKPEVAELEGQLNDAKTQKSSTAPVWLLGIGIFGLLLSIARPVLFLLFVPLVVGMVLYIRSRKRAKERVLLPIEEALGRKKEELAKHQQVVSDSSLLPKDVHPQK